MKIIGGKYKNRNIFMPEGIRPTQNMVREAFFDLLGQDLEGIEFLELFSGSGAIGIEAISRGAKKVTFVEKEKKCVQVLRENLELLKVEPTELGLWPYDILYSCAFKGIKTLHNRGMKFDVIFIDPPYGRDMAKKALKTLECYDILQPNCVLILQTDKHEILPEEQGRFLMYKNKKYGSTTLAFYKAIENNI